MKLKMKWVGMLAGVLITLLVAGVAMAAGTTDWEKGSVQTDGAKGQGVGDGHLYHVAHVQVDQWVVGCDH